MNKEIIEAIAKEFNRFNHEYPYYEGNCKQLLSDLGESVRDVFASYIPNFDLDKFDKDSGFES
jgi:hypothetical protein